MRSDEVIRLMNLLLYAALLLMSAHVGAEEITTEVITLKHRLAAEVLPIIQPLIPPPGGVSAMDAQLILRATPANLAEIRGLLDKVDRPPRQLLITVRQSARQDRQRDEMAVEGEVSAGGGKIELITGGEHQDEGVVITHEGERQRVRTRVLRTQ